MLMAFADDALPAETAAALARRIAADPRLAARVGRFKADRALLRAAFDPVLQEPVPDRLVRAVRAKAATAERPRPGLRLVASGTAEVAPGPGASGGAGRSAAGGAPRRWLPLALAASLALLLGYGAGRLAGPEGPAAPGLAALAETPALARLAEAELSGGAADLPGGARAVLLGSARLPDGRLCREAEIAGQSVAGTALLCRTAAGGWTVTALLAEPPPAPGSTFAPASGAATSAHPPLWATLGGERLDGEAERAARAAGWR
jgi:hypothetical protein